MVFFPDGALPLKEAYERFQTCFPSRSRGADGEGADKDDQDDFIADLLSGAFIVKVFDPKRNRIFSLTHRQLTDYFFLDLLIARGAIGDFTDGPLADYVGLTPYVERSDFEEWLGTLMSEESRADDLQDSAASTFKSARADEKRMH